MNKFDFLCKINFTKFPSQVLKMILPSLPNECLSDILTFLDKNSLYKCLFVSRQYCKLSIPIIWRDPICYYSCYPKSSLVVINTLLACLDEDEISSLIP